MPLLRAFGVLLPGRPLDRTAAAPTLGAGVDGDGFVVLALAGHAAVAAAALEAAGVTRPLRLDDAGGQPALRLRRSRARGYLGGQCDCVWQRRMR